MFVDERIWQIEESAVHSSQNDVVRNCCKVRDIVDSIRTYTITVNRGEHNRPNLTSKSLVVTSGIISHSKPAVATKKKKKKSIVDGEAHTHECYQCDEEHP